VVNYLETLSFLFFHELDELTSKICARSVLFTKANRINHIFNSIKFSC